MPKKPALYEALIVRIFNNHYQKRLDAFEFDRTEIETVAAELKLRLPKNLGDLTYYLSVIIFGIFMTARSVDALKGRP